MNPSVETIKHITAGVFGVHVSVLTVKPSPKLEAGRPRQVAMYLSRQLTRRSLHYISRRFNRHHKAVVHAANRIEVLMREDPAFAAKVNVARHAVQFLTPYYAIQRDKQAAFQSSEVKR